MVSRGSTARATSIARCGDRPVARRVRARRPPPRGSRAPPARPSPTLGRPFGQPREERLQIADHLELRRHQRVGARRARQRQDRDAVGPRLRLQLDGVEADGDDQVGLRDELALDQAADDAAGAQRMILGDDALAFRGRQHRRAEALGERDELGRCAVPEDAEADQDDGLARLRRACRAAASRLARPGSGARRFGISGGSAGQVAGLPRRLALRHVELDRTRRRAGRRRA